MIKKSEKEGVFLLRNQSVTKKSPSLALIMSVKQM